MGTLQNHMINFMKTRGYSDKTIVLYTTCVHVFAFHYHQSPLDINTEQIESFFLFLRSHNKSESTVHIYYEALKFFYKIHNINDRLPKFSFKNINHKIPEILSQNEVFTLLSNCTSLKYKTIFTLIYSAGLRISEAANLKLSDINFDRKTIYIRNGKNNKDRYTILANETIILLRNYFLVYHPISYIFYSTEITRRISTDSIERQFKKLILSNGINRPIHVHTLRHCFATHLLENGTSIFFIMKLLGHSNIQTTMIYLHMRALDQLELVSPIDNYHFSEISHGTDSQPELFLATA